MSKHWKRYHVRVYHPDDEKRNNPVHEKWYIIFETAKKELKELAKDRGWEGYPVDIREYRHQPDKWVWRAKL